jgi:hypothetical protein
MGSTFGVRCHYRSPARRPRETPRSILPRDAADLRCKCSSVNVGLVVDDNVDAAATECCFSIWDMTLNCARRRARYELRPQNPDVIFMDIGLPEMSDIRWRGVCAQI